MPRISNQNLRNSESARLRKLREQMNLSQREMATEFGVAPGAISFWESGRRTIPGPVLKLMGIYEQEFGTSIPALSSTNSISGLRASWISRQIRLSAAAAGIAARFAKSRALPFQGPSLEIATQIAPILGELKGPLMKIGQMMSYLDSGLPETTKKSFEQLQDQSTALNGSVIESVFLEEFNEKPSQIFLQWSPIPAGTGSVGQVHWAKLKNGTEVAVKIKYPKIESVVSSALNNTKAVELFSHFLGQKTTINSTLLAELRERITEECHYNLEMQYHKIFKTHFKDAPGILIPDVFDELSTNSVLTTSFIHGQNFQNFLKQATQAQKNAAAQNIFQFVYDSIFNLKLANVDPHPGNYLFLQDQVAFIDFGCVKKLNSRFVSQWVKYFYCLRDRKYDQADKLVEEMGWVNQSNRKMFDHRYHHEMMELLFKPWLHKGSFKFESHYVSQVGMRLVVDNPNKYRILIPKDWLFICRLQWGLYSLLAQLNADGDWNSLIHNILKNEDSK